MLLLCKEGHILMEYSNFEFVEFTKYDEYKHLGLVYPFMCIFEENLGSSDPKLLMLSYDTKRRLQYKYNSSHLQQSVTNKQNKILALIDSYESAMNKLLLDLSGHDEYRQILACMVFITYKTGIRIGKDSHFKTYNTVGLSTLQKKHVTFTDGICIFEFIGKKGVHHKYEISDKMLVKILKKLYNSTADFIFYASINGRSHKITYMDINEYVKQLFNSDMLSGKDFRTLLANILFLEKFLSNTETNQKKRVTTSIKHVADELHNTRAVSKKSYVFKVIMEYIEQNGTDDLHGLKPLDVLKRIFKS